MSIINYFKNFWNPVSKKERKRRRTEVNLSDGSQLPKYRRVSSIFPKKYPVEDDIDHFQQVKQKRHHYNVILENFLMEQQNQQRKQFEAINADGEFSDDEEISSIRMPSVSGQRSQPQTSTTGFNFKPRQSVPDTFSFAQKSQLNARDDRDVQFVSQKQLSKPPIPGLVPISRSIPVHNGLKPNGFGSFPPQNRKSLIDFTNKNRAFNESSTISFKQSVLDRNHQLETKHKYDSLLKSLIPRFPSKATKQVTEALLQRQEPIPTVDVSSDETETSAAAFGGETSRTKRFSTQLPTRAFEFKKPSAFVDLSDDDDTDPFFSVAPMSSTVIKGKNSESVRRSTSFRRDDSNSSTIPDVKPVNTLADRQLTRDCMKSDILDKLYQKHKENRQKNDSQINDVSKTVSQLSLETKEQEKWQQSRIDISLSSLKQAIILDEEEEVIDEYPPLNEQQLQLIRYGLHGPRNEVIKSKFNMNITRNDLLTLDGLNWLNDEVINFYMELLRERSEQCDHLPKVYVMNTFFIPKLLQQGHSGVRRWTRKVDIFAYDIIPVPVHVGGVHWCMSIINIRDKSIRYYDSMGHPNFPVLEALKRYLQEESMDKKKVPYDVSDWTIENVRDCPQQRNGSDCGVFSCMFAEFLSRDSKISFEQDHMQYFRRKMVFEIASGKLVLGY